jgi:hypothetical protein
VKSSLKRPLKFLIRFLSSVLPREAIEVVACSKYSLEIIARAFEKPYFMSALLSNIVCVGKALLLGIPAHSANIKTTLIIG